MIELPLLPGGVDRAGLDELAAALMAATDDGSQSSADGSRPIGPVRSSSA